ncbi:MAG TPA: DUF3482 domain-containing protein [Xanthomonadales bacterium]|nr:DUF3482 domain-containing protein [Xanthomonadales bacterium]
MTPIVPNPSAPLRLALVGHTNTGKTSLVRTLSRDPGFGEVSSRPGTTRHVEGVRLMVDGIARVELYDTPGLEDPIELLARLDGLAAGQRRDGPDRIEQFLNLPEADGRFEQEAKVLRQMCASDAALHVIDARDPVLPKHRDELAILALCGIPLLPVLNFVAGHEADPGAWRRMLAGIGLHAVVEFDAVAPERDAESVLYRKLSTLLDAFCEPLERLIAARQREAEHRRQAALTEIAALLIDAGAARIPVAGSADPTSALEALADAVRRREHACRQALLELHRFSEQTVRSPALASLSGRWQSDLFAPEALADMGIRLGTGVAAGAATGVGIDLATGGLTLGAAAALGALAGGTWQTLRHYGSRLKGRLTGHRELSLDDAILRLLALRQLHLVRTLEARGHGAVSAIDIPAAVARPWRQGRLPASLRRARAHPGWSALVAAAGDPSGRSSAIARLAHSLAEEMSIDPITEVD